MTGPEIDLSPLTDGQLSSLDAAAQRGKAEPLDVRRLIADLRKARGQVAAVRALATAAREMLDDHPEFGGEASIALHLIEGALDPLAGQVYRDETPWSPEPPVEYPAAPTHDPLASLRTEVAAGRVAVWCPCHDTPEPAGTWIAPDEEHADTHVLDWLAARDRERSAPRNSEETPAAAVPDEVCPDCGDDPRYEGTHRGGCRRILPSGHPLEALQFGPPWLPWPEDDATPPAAPTPGRCCAEGFQDDCCAGIWCVECDHPEHPSADAPAAPVPDLMEALLQSVRKAKEKRAPAAPTHGFEGNGLTGSVECQECGLPASDPVHGGGRGMSGPRAITVRQPWAWAIAHRGKDVENREWATSWTGPLLIHAGKGIDLADIPTVAKSTGFHAEEIDRWIIPGAVLAVATMTGEHVCSGKCSRLWAVSGAHHFQLTHVRPLDQPIPTKGALGLWRPAADLLAAVREQIPGWAEPTWHGLSDPTGVTDCCHRAPADLPGDRFRLVGAPGYVTCAGVAR